MKVARSDLGGLTFIAEGGSGRVFKADDFFLPGDPTPLAYKEFRGGDDFQARSAAAAAAVTLFRDGLSPQDRDDLDRYCAWPRTLVEETTGKICGLLMPQIHQEFSWPGKAGEPGMLDFRLRTADWLIADARMRAAAGVDMEVDRTGRLLLLAQLVYAVGRLHKRGWVFGDISFTNAAFALDPPRLKLFDCDGAAALTDYGREQSHTPFWMPPEHRSGQQLQDTVTDAYKLGLAIVRGLVPGRGASQTKDVGRIHGQLDPRAVALVTDALSDDRSRRPTARELYSCLYREISPEHRGALPQPGVLDAPSRPLAGVRSDAPSAEDLLRSTADVETLADLIAARETAAPLAVALIGDWGAGKSSLMLQIQRHIDVLAEMSRISPDESL